MTFLKNWFDWNGVRCTTRGIFVSEQPPITIPQERSKQTTIPGRPGSLTTLEGNDVYEDITLTATCYIRDPSLIPSIAGWLKGSGKVIFANRPGGFYNARISNQIPFEKILRGKSALFLRRELPLFSPILVCQQSLECDDYHRQLYPDESRHCLLGTHYQCVWQWRYDAHYQ